MRSSAPRLSRAMAVSAATHLGVLAALLALAQPRTSSTLPMRVALVGAAARIPSSPGEPGPMPGRTGRETTEFGTDEGIAPAGLAPIAAPPPPTRTIPRGVHRAWPGPGPTAPGNADGAARAAALVAPVQSDVWMLSGPGEPPVAGATPPPPGPAGRGPGRAGGEAGGAADGARAASLLAALSERLAWSAERCAPHALVRTARHAIPGVPLHFCLDAAGRPSDVGLLGTTGSEQLDRAARDCVVPGALPLPPAPGCYTVEVRFPTRG